MRTLRTLAAAVAVVALAACAPAPAPEAATGTPADEQAIRDLLADWVTNWNAADTTGLAGLLAEDYQEVQPDGVHLQNRAAVEAMMVEELATRPEGITMTLETVFVQWQSANLASVGGTFALNGLPEDAPPGLPAGGSWLVVAKREGDRWVLTNGLGAAYVPPPTEG